jgi:hypothetical protein
MNESENNFESLRRLLKAKRHEAPPPGYFNTFSGQVISRIRVGESDRAPGFSGYFQFNSSWLLNFLRRLEARPGVIGAFATSLCLLLLVGVVVAERPDVEPQNALTASMENQPASLLASTVSPVSVSDVASAGQLSGIAASTNPIASLQPVATLFGQAGASPLFQSASFSPVGN